MGRQFNNLEKIGILVLFLFAIFVRFLNLGSLPLSDAEAGIGLSAARLLAEGASASPDVLLVNVIAAMMYLFGQTEIVVRFLPALCGSLLILLPFLFRDIFEKQILMVVSVWLAIDPGLIALSRQANSSILVFVFAVLLLFAYLRKQPVWTGIFGACLLACGTAFWFAALPLILFVFYRLVFRNQNKENPALDNFSVGGFPTRKGLITFGIALLFVGTFAFAFPSQFGRILQGLVSYIQGWGSGGGTNLVTLPRVLFLYHSPLILFALLGIILGWRSHAQTIGFLLSWLIANLLHVLLYPAWQLDYVLWILAPLIAAASLMIHKTLHIPQKDAKLIGLISAGGGVILVYLTLIAMNVIVSPVAAVQSQISRPGLLIAGVALIVLAVILIGWSLSWKIAGTSVLIISLAYLGVFTLSAGWNAAGLRLPFENELWYLSPVPVNEDLLIGSIEDIAALNNKHVQTAEIQVIGIDSPALEWALRNFSDVSVAGQFAVNTNPQFIISEASGGEMAMVEAYIGQDFDWRSSPAWDLLYLQEWANWLVTRRIPANLTNPEAIILWVRSDLFPGSASQ